MFKFEKTPNEYYLYIPKYVDFQLIEEEVAYTPRVLRVGLSSYYKRPTVGYSYKIEGTIWQKTFYELMRQEWEKVWVGVFVRIYIVFPVGGGWSRPSGVYNLFVITGDVVVENLEVVEAMSISENPVKFTLRYNKVLDKKRPLWLANATFQSGEFIMGCLDIGKLHTSDNPTPRNVDVRNSVPPDGLVYFASYYPGLQYTFTSSDWEILPNEFYTVQDTSLPYSDADLTPTYLTLYDGSDN